MTRDLMRYTMSDGQMVHLVDRGWEWATLCSLGTLRHVMRRVERPVDCMTCLVRANGPFVSERIATALGIPNKFLYGDSDDKDVGDER